MKDISRKVDTLRTAMARSVLELAPETLDLVRAGKIPKGDPLPVARVAAVQAAKNTPLIVPYCHPLPISFVGVEFELADGVIRTDVTVKAIYKTGVEMEALTAAAAAAITLYDMMKMLDDTMAISGVRLLEKKGGKSDFRDQAGLGQLRGAVLVMSDSIAAGSKSDASGLLIRDRLTAEGVEVVDYRVVPDDPRTIEEQLLRYADAEGLNLVVTTGGTGFGPRDNTPEVMARIVEREVPGIPEAGRAYGQARTPYSMLSRGRAGIRGSTLIVNLPGSQGGVADSLDALFPALLHAFKMLRGEGHPPDEP